MSLDLVDETGAHVELGSILGRGGEGTVHAVAQDRNAVAKIFLPARRTRETHDKLRAMIRRPPQGAAGRVHGFPVLTWPTRLLYAGRPRRSRFLGYTMPRADLEHDFVPLHQVVSARRRAPLAGTALGLRHLLLVGARMAHVVRTLHALGYAIGDLNDRNVMVSRRLTPLFLDADSFQVPHGLLRPYACRVGDRLYWPPELLDVNLQAHHPDRKASDRYALACLLFQLLMDGYRPYQARGRLVDALETLAEKTRAGHFPWSRPRPRILEPPVGAPPFSRLPPPVRAAFHAAFVDGHARPRRRPTADAWYQVLVRSLESIHG